MVNCIWFATTAVSLFLAGTTGIIASAFGIHEKPTTGDGTKVPRLKRRYCSYIILAIALFAMLVAMTAGVLILANDITVNTPLGSKHLSPRVIYGLIGVAVAGMIGVAGWFVWLDFDEVHKEVQAIFSRCKSFLC